jgi:hypothetical protein
LLNHPPAVMLRATCSCPWLLVFRLTLVLISVLLHILFKTVVLIILKLCLTHKNR